MTKKGSSIQRLGYDARLLERFGNDDCIDIAAFERLGQDVGIVLSSISGIFGAVSRSAVMSLGRR